MGSSENRKGKIRGWKPYSEAEHLELYRRVWGSAWKPAGTDARAQLIQQHMIVVETITGMLLRAGQNSAIPKADLLQIGYTEMIRTIDRQQAGALALDKRIARNCKTAMIRFIRYELREQRYVQQGRHKAIRDTRVALGVPSAAGHLKAEERDAETGIQLEAQAAELTGDGDESAEASAVDEFVYRDWLRGFVPVFRARGDQFAEVARCDLPDELAEIAHGVGYRFVGESCAHIRPVLECLRQPSSGRVQNTREHHAATSTVPSRPGYRGLFWDNGPRLLREARESRPAKTAETVVPTARFSMLRSRVPVY